MDGLNGFKELFPDDSEWVDYVIRNPLFFQKDIVVRQAREYRQAIRICFDPDGNHHPEKEILKYRGHRISWGNTSSVVNYNIAHILGKTDNPLFFSYPDSGFLQKGTTGSTEKKITF